MSDDEWVGDEPKKTKSSKRKESKSKSKSSRRPVAEAASGWSNDIDGDDVDVDGVKVPPAQSSIIRQSSRRATEEVAPAAIPTISTDDVEGDDANEVPPQATVAPQFSVYQIASYQDFESEISRTRASQFIDSKIDIGILYHNLHLQGELDAEDQRLWDWDKVFVEVRKAITTVASDSNL